MYFVGALVTKVLFPE